MWKATRAYVYHFHINNYREEKVSYQQLWERKRRWRLSWSNPSWWSKFWPGFIRAEARLVNNSYDFHCIDLMNLQHELISNYYTLYYMDLDLDFIYSSILLIWTRTEGLGHWRRVGLETCTDSTRTWQCQSKLHRFSSLPSNLNSKSSLSIENTCLMSHNIYNEKSKLHKTTSIIVELQSHLCFKNYNAIPYLMNLFQC